MKQIRMPVILLLIFGILLLGCITTQPQEKGILQGHITIGPLCPVETNPPDPNCQPTEETYAAYVITVDKYDGSTMTGKTKFTEFYGDKFGNYRIELPPGKYSIHAGNFGSIPTFINNNVEIKAGETTNLDIDIDTGIR